MSSTSTSAGFSDFVEQKLIPRTPWWFLGCFCSFGRLPSKRHRELSWMERYSMDNTFELLVDGDVHSIHEIQEAINYLNSISSTTKCHTRIFAPPGRAENKKWFSFMRRSDITFCAVQRAVEASREANDERIISTLLEVGKSEILCSLDLGVCFIWIVVWRKSDLTMSLHACNTCFHKYNDIGDMYMCIHIYIHICLFTHLTCRFFVPSFFARYL